ncbi:hypothetical protein ABEV55_08500 [Aneurinibacillus thermoaerophilus]|uniref:hypothetical protein n=1 Tax=Aneurinibacillus thermoaerophilus TaxID=143495 RepID=UPI002E1E1D84|nr:hypothetical protein [Aneurinibacillus thermoaerophilus]
MNEQLVNQMKLQMTKNSSTLRLKKEGTLHFFVRNGVLQKKFEEDEVLIVNGDHVAVPENDVELSEEGIDMLFSLIRNAFVAYGETKGKIEYGHMYINYRIDNEGTPFNKVALRVVTEEHYKWS